MVDSRKLNCKNRYKIGDTIYTKTDIGIEYYEVVSVDKDDEYMYEVYDAEGLCEYWVNREIILMSVKNNKLNRKLYKEEIYKIEDEWIILKNT